MKTRSILLVLLFFSGLSFTYVYKNEIPNWYTDIASTFTYNHKQQNISIPPQNEYNRDKFLNTVQKGNNRQWNVSGRGNGPVADALAGAGEKIFNEFNATIVSKEDGTLTLINKNTSEEYKNIAIHKNIDNKIKIKPGSYQSLFESNNGKKKITTISATSNPIYLD